MNFDINIISDGTTNRVALPEKANPEVENEINDQKVEEKS